MEENRIKFPRKKERKSRKKERKKVLGEREGERALTGAERVGLL